MTALWKPGQSIQSWNHLQDAYRHYSETKDREYVFRGLSDRSHTLSTTLERTFEAFGISKAKDRLNAEEALLREFQRRAHHYLPRVPDQDDVLEWLALMRHHGAPCRLLDVTYSFWVASYHAVSKSQMNSSGNFECKIWLLDKKASTRAANRKLGRSNARDELPASAGPKSWERFDSILWSPKKKWRLIYHVNPFTLNERLTAQQSAFLCPSDISVSFEDNLKALDLPNDSSATFMLSLAESSRSEILRELRRCGITEASMYPGLDGFARSLLYYSADPQLTSTFPGNRNPPPTKTRKGSGKRPRKP